MFFGATLLGRYADRAGPPHGVPGEPRHLLRLHAARRVQRQRDDADRDEVSRGHRHRRGAAARRRLLERAAAGAPPRALHRVGVHARVHRHPRGRFSRPAARAAAAVRHRRMAMDVRRRIAGRRGRVGDALEAARVAALARIGGPDRGGRRDRVAHGARGRGARDRSPPGPARDRLVRPRALPRDLRRAVPRAHADALRVPHLPDGRLLRIRHARADGAGREGLLDRDVADVHVADLHRLSGRLGAVAADRRAGRSPVADRRLGGVDERVRPRRSATPRRPR